MSYRDISEETIAAISTPKGIGGIGIVRISGLKALEIMEKIFVGIGDSKITSRYLNYGHIINKENNEIIDEVLAVYMKAPTTYTGEDVVEINCHGGIIPLEKTLQLIINQGAILSEPGEFTKRGFLNGRIDLAQAEAVMDMISAKTSKSFNVAIDQLQGKLSSDIKKIRSELVDLLVSVTVNIDYPDEDIEEITYGKLHEDLNRVYNHIKLLIESSKRGKILRDGLKVAIIGKPNVGKSSLMNLLLNENRAIVTEVAGTTRDTIEEELNIRGIPIILTDTAGIRETEDIVEKIGIERSKDAFNKADLVLFIIDSSRPLDKEDREILEYLREENTIILYNKADLPSESSFEELKSLVGNVKIISTSMEENLGISEIEDEIEILAGSNSRKEQESTIINNIRHKEILIRAFESIRDAISAVTNREPLEIVEIDINKCYMELGEIIGETAEEDIINQVFARFCLGK